MEANKYAFDMTLHKCDAPNAKEHFYNCDTGISCGVALHANKANKWSDGKVYGPGE